ncbi:MAG: ABC transporter permease [Ignavibacteria bacterium]|jgi:simple sugar transport system permease protein|nr:ABC transporter permease [Ignavibacteria bacterium]
MTFLVAGIFLLVIGRDPVIVFSKMFGEVFGTGYGIGQTIFKTTPLIICGCGLALCFHASVFNIGAEGQINIGAFIMALTVFKLDDYLGFMAFPAAVLAGFAASALWGFIPAVIKVKREVSEVITTIMMNFIAFALVNYMLLEFFAVKSTVRTPEILNMLFLPKLSDLMPFFQGSSANFTFVIAVLLAVVLYFIIYKTIYGYSIRSVGKNPLASKYFGININKVYILSFVAGAGITSLVGINFIFGYKGYYELGFSNNLGFTAIAVSLLAKNNPIGIIFSAFLFGILDFGGLAVNSMVPKEIMLVLQSLVILSILITDKLVNKYIKNTANA